MDQTEQKNSEPKKQNTVAHVANAAVIYTKDNGLALKTKIILWKI